MHRMTHTSFRAIHHALNDAGADVDALIQLAGFSTEEAYDNPKGIRLELVYKLMREAMHCTGNPDIGLLTYARAHPAHLDALGYAVMSCATLGAALQRLVDYHSLITNGFSLFIERSPGHVKLGGYGVAIEPDLMPRAFIDAGVAQTLGLIHWLVPQHKPRPVRAALTYPQPEDTTQLEALFGCDIQFSAPNSSMTFREEDCRLPLPSADPALDVMHVEHARSKLNQMLNKSVTEHVRRTLSSQLSMGQACDLESIARQVGVSARGLQRRLGMEHIHFSALQDEARLTQAHNFLRNSDRSIKYIGAMLGFREQSSFHKACIRWFGMTPGRYRELT